MPSSGDAAGELRRRAAAAFHVPATVVTTRETPAADELQASLRRGRLPSSLLLSRTTRQRAACRARPNALTVLEASVASSLAGPRAGTHRQERRRDRAARAPGSWCALDTSRGQAPPAKGRGYSFVGSCSAAPVESQCRSSSSPSVSRASGETAASPGDVVGACQALPGANGVARRFALIRRGV